MTKGQQRGKRKQKQPQVSKGRAYAIIISRSVTIVTAVMTAGSLIGVFLGYTQQIHVMICAIICLIAALVYRLTGFYYVDKKK